MMANFFETKQTLSISDIEKFEAEVKFILPQRYKEHLLKFNGGYCEPNIFEIIEDGTMTTSSISWFYAIQEATEGSSLMTVIRTLKIDHKRMPSHIFPIAYDEVGNEICISGGENDLGVIYFWDHEKEVDYSVEDDSNYNNLYFIAPSLDVFLDNLKSIEDM
jgi:hypothetical protein